MQHNWLIFATTAKYTEYFLYLYVQTCRLLVCLIIHYIICKLALRPHFEPHRSHFLTLSLCDRLSPLGLKQKSIKALMGFIHLVMHKKTILLELTWENDWKAALHFLFLCLIQSDTGPVWNQHRFSLMLSPLASDVKVNQLTILLLPWDILGRYFYRFTLQCLALTSFQIQYQRYFGFNDKPG